MRQVSETYQPGLNDVSVWEENAGSGRATGGGLTAIGALQRLEPKETLVWEGDAAADVFQIVRGVACLYKLLPDGRRQVARFCFAGDIVGLAADACYPYTVDALTDLTVARVRRAALDSRIETDRSLRQAVMRALGRELSVAQNQLLLLGRKSASERVATFLQAMVAQALRDGGDGRSVALAMTRIDIADYLGLTHETVCRTISLFKAQGIIATPDPHLIEIRRPDLLVEIAEGDRAEALCA